MKVHKEGTGLLLTLFTIFFVVDVALYHTVGRGWVFYTTTFVTTVLFLLVLNFFRSPFRPFPVRFGRIGDRPARWYDCGDLRK